MAEILATEIAADITETIVAAAEDIIVENAEKAETAAIINEALVETLMEGHEARARGEFEDRIFAALNETNERLGTCLDQIQDLQSTVERLSLTAQTAETMAETLLIQTALNPPSEGAGDLPAEELPAAIDPEANQPETPAPPSPPKKPKHRLL